MIKFYADEDGIKYGGCFLEGNKAFYTYDEEESEKVKRWFDNGTTIDELHFHYLTKLQVETLTNR